MFNTQFDARLSRGDGNGDRPTQILLKGDGDKNHPYYIQNARFAGETTRIKDILTFAQNNGVTQVNIAFSGVPWVFQPDGKWHRKAQTISLNSAEIERSTVPMHI